MQDRGGGSERLTAASSQVTWLVMEGFCLFRFLAMCQCVNGSMCQCCRAFVGVQGLVFTHGWILLCVKMFLESPAREWSFWFL